MHTAQGVPSPRHLTRSDLTRRHQSALLLVLVALGVGLRGLLAAWSPTPYGYVFDFYHEAIQLAYATGSLPAAADCWQCYHPPLHPLVGLPLYAAGKAIVGGPGAGLADPALRFVTPLSLLCGGVTAWFAYRMLRLYRFRGTELVLGTGLILVLPCLFISSYGIEADILLTALMTAFVYYLVKFLYQGRSTPLARSVGLGMLAGLACATKYTGLLAPVILVSLTAMHLAARRGRSFLVPRAALVLVVAVALGSWQYIENLYRYQRPLFANGSALQGFSVADRPSFWGDYDFRTLQMRDLFRLNRGRVPPAQLANVPFYHSVWTTLHAMAWGDMSMFSDPSRHGFHLQPYPRKIINPRLASSVLVLGLVPGALAVVGFVITLRRRILWPLAVTSVVTLVAYVAWFVAQESWALKTKYILFLLPAYVVYAMLGLRWVRRFSPLAAQMLAAALTLLIFAAHVYLLDFVSS
jgi:hypothetical protein